MTYMSFNRKFQETAMHRPCCRLQDLLLPRMGQVQKRAFEWYSHTLTPFLVVSLVCDALCILSWHLPLAATRLDSIVNCSRCGHATWSCLIGTTVPVSEICQSFVPYVPWPLMFWWSRSGSKLFSSVDGSQVFGDSTGEFRPERFWNKQLG